MNKLTILAAAALFLTASLAWAGPECDGEKAATTDTTETSETVAKTDTGE